MENKSCPLLHEVIPALDYATQYLEKAVKNATTVSTVRVAAARGLVVVDEYYSKTDESIMYRSAMSKLFVYLATSKN